MRLLPSRTSDWLGRLKGVLLKRAPSRRCWKVAVRVIIASLFDILWWSVPPLAAILLGHPEAPYTRIPRVPTGSKRWRPKLQRSTMKLQVDCYTRQSYIYLDLPGWIRPAGWHGQGLHYLDSLIIFWPRKWSLLTPPAALEDHLEKANAEMRISE